MGTDLVIFDHGQVTRTTPELALSLRTFPLCQCKFRQIESAETQSPFIGVMQWQKLCISLYTGWVVKCTKLELMTRWSRVRDLDHLATTVTIGKVKLQL
ncbi:hypothetical protein TNCV_3098401 [Trichonephila clavipes]|nr:hypothetical protein TNCV_3098401 [Trichonephila clavipes]